MALEIPDWVEPIFDLYGIPWPDVDEDAFHELKQPLHDFGEDIQGVAVAIEDALRLLLEGNPSRSLEALLAYARSVHRDFISPVRSICLDLAGSPCDIAYELIQTAKWALIGLVTSELANDVADIAATVITFGLDSALTTAEAVALRNAVSDAMTRAEGDIVAALGGAANRVIDELASSIVNPFVNMVSGRVEGLVDTYTPRLLLAQARHIEEGAGAEASGARRLHLNPIDLNACITAVMRSSEHLDRAEQRLSSLIDEAFAHPAPNAPRIGGSSSVMRAALKEAVHVIRADLVTALRNLIHEIEHHFTALLDDYKRALASLDEQAREHAAKQHAPAVGALVMTAGVAAATAFAAAGASAAANRSPTVSLAEDRSAVVSRFVQAYPVGAEVGPPDCVGQCVGLFEEYTMHYVHTREIELGVNGGACDLYTRFNDFPELKDNYTQLPPSATPEPGDVAVWDSSTPYSGGYGHVAIVTAVNGNSVQTLQQNGDLRHPYTITDGTLTVGEPHLLGYLRPNTLS